MKILVINPVFRKNTGGGGGGSRNIALLRDSFGAENIVRYDVSDYQSKIQVLLYAVAGYSLGVTPKIIKDIKKTVRSGRYDYVFINHSKLGRLSKSLKNDCKVITFFHNIEILYTWYHLKNAPFAKRIFYLPLLLSGYANERQAVCYSAKIIALTSRDSGNLLKIYGKKADLILPLTFADRFNDALVEKYSAASDKKTLLFVGVDIPINTSGLFWFIENCLDNIHAALVVVGAGMERYQHKYPGKAGKAVEFVGWADNLDEYYYKADAVVAPLLSASGMKTKTCEALMFGKTIFGTREAFEGFDALDLEKTGFLCESADDFITKINRYLSTQQSKMNPYTRTVFLSNYENKCAAAIMRGAL